LIPEPAKDKIFAPAPSPETFSKFASAAFEFCLRNSSSPGFNYFLIFYFYKKKLN